MRIVIVGNAPLERDFSALVDRADLVVRFNEPRTWSNVGGARFDVWMIDNGMGSVRFADDRTFLKAPWRDIPSDIWYPRDVSVHRQYLSRFPAARLRPGVADLRSVADRISNENRLNQTKTFFSATEYEKAFILLGEFKAYEPVQIPSSGCAALVYASERFPDASIDMVGFGFQGADIHPWDAERMLVDAAIKSGRVTYHSPNSFGGNARRWIKRLLPTG